MYMYYPSDEPWVLEMREWIIKNPLTEPIGDRPPPKPPYKPKSSALVLLNHRINRLLKANTKQDGYPHYEEIRRLRKLRKKLIS